METIFENRENIKTSEPHKFVLHLSQRLDVRKSNKHVALQNLFICFTWKNIKKKHYKNNNLEIIAPTWNDELEFCQIFKIILNISLKTWNINNNSSYSYLHQ